RLLHDCSTGIGHKKTQPNLPTWLGFLIQRWCPGEDSNLHTLRHMDLNHARLPIPPPGHFAISVLPKSEEVNYSKLKRVVKRLVPRRGLEPPHLAAHGPEPCASTNSATWA